MGAVMDPSEMNRHQLDMVVIMDCLGEDFDELFLDEDYELSIEAAMTLAGLALRLLDGDLSLTELDRDYADWVELISGFIDGYDMRRLYDIRFTRGPNGEPETEAEWPGPGTLRFYRALAVELGRYMEWSFSGRPGIFEEGDASSEVSERVRLMYGWPPPEQPPTLSRAPGVPRHHRRQGAAVHRAPGQPRSPRCR